MALQRGLDKRSWEGKDIFSGTINEKGAGFGASIMAGVVHTCIVNKNSTAENSQEWCIQNFPPPNCSSLLFVQNARPPYCVFCLAADAQGGRSLHGFIAKNHGNCHLGFEPEKSCGMGKFSTDVLYDISSQVSIVRLVCRGFRKGGGAMN